MYDFTSLAMTSAISQRSSSVSKASLVASIVPLPDRQTIEMPARYRPLKLKWNVYRTDNGLP
ncbi:MAG: hypothetical protein ACD_23C00698G0002 [uncultured bacterium]|nr:MAG: hypothetical protein ACD_23C00698G0002 [uncultured bacterium]